ncbi:MAG: hypothetical protein IH881_16015 [Myxococcales bacterium]|nr:hypothetical protein [Myxococcales bacterium]
MSANTGNAPAWLFSFLDLAFLLLIAVLLAADRDQVSAPDLAAMELPEIQRSNTDSLQLGSEAPWQLRIHPRRAAEDLAAFSLVNGQPADEVRIASRELKLALAGLHGRSGAKPLLAPHRDSRSEDFLTALGFVQEVWPATHTAAVRPIAQAPAVSAAPIAIESP